MFWFLASMMLCLAFFILKMFTTSPAKVLDHVTYLSGTLGTGKSGFGSLCARIFVKQKMDVYCTFALLGTIPFDLFYDPWPTDSNIAIILDEMLLLEANDFIDWGKFSDGLALARQKGQIVIILSQAHRPGWGKLSGTIGTYAIVRGMSFGNLFRIVRIQRSSEPFVRMNGFKSKGVLSSFHIIPGSCFRSYNSKMIFGYTCDKQLKKFSEDDMTANRIERAAVIAERAAIIRAISSSRARAAVHALHGGLQADGESGARRPHRVKQSDPPRPEKYDW